MPKCVLIVHARGRDERCSRIIREITMDHSLRAARIHALCGSRKFVAAIAMIERNVLLQIQF